MLTKISRALLIPGLALVTLGQLFPPFRYLFFVGLLPWALFAFASAGPAVERFYDFEGTDTLRVKPNGLKFKALGLAVALNLLSLVFFEFPTERTFICLWVLSLCIAIPALSFPSSCQKLTPASRDIVAVAVLLLVSIIGRYWYFNVEAPYHVEGLWINAGFETLRDVVRSPFQGIGDYPSVWPAYILGISFWLFPLPHDPLTLSRLTALIPGALCVPLLYLLVVLIFENRIVAFATALLWAVSAWMVNESLYVVHFSLLHFLQLVLFAGVVLGFKKRSHTSFIVIAGVAAGLLFNFLYVHAVSIIPVVAVLAFEGICQWRKVKRDFALRLGILLIVFALTISPTVYRVVFVDWEVAVGRHIQALSMGDTAGLEVDATMSPTANLLKGAKEFFSTYFFFQNYENHYRFRERFLSGPVFDVITNILLLLGLGASIVRVRRAPYLLSILLFLGVFLPFVLRPESDHRLTASAPAIFLFVATALYFLYQAATPLFESRNVARYMLGGVLVAGLIYSTFDNHKILRGAFANRLEQQWHDPLALPTRRIGAEMVKLASTCDFYVNAESASDPRMQYIIEAINHPDSIHRSTGLHDIPFRNAPTDRPLCVFLGRYYYDIDPDQAQALLRYFYPQAREYPLTESPTSAPYADVFVIQPADFKMIEGLEPVTEGGERFHNGESVSCLNCEFSGSLLIPESGFHVASMEGVNDFRLSIDGVSALPAQEHFLAKGPHVVELKFSRPADAKSALYLEMNGRGERVIASLVSKKVPESGITTILSGASDPARENVTFKSSTFAETVWSDLFRYSGGYNTMERTGSFVVEATGEYYWVINSGVPAKFYLNEKLLIDSPTGGLSSIESVTLEKGTQVTLRVVSTDIQSRPEAYVYLLGRKPGTLELSPVSIDIFDHSRFKSIQP